MRDVSTIDAYIAMYPAEVQVVLEKLRRVILSAAPGAVETIAYGIPTFKLNGNLVHFGAYKNHIGFYPAPRGIAAFQKEVAPYIAGKGTLQFSLEASLPFDLIGRIVAFRVAENLARKK